MLKLIPVLSFMFCFNLLGMSQDFEKWKMERRHQLLTEDGWVNLRGFYWLDHDLLFLNKASSDSLFISKQASRYNIGNFVIKNDSVWFLFNPKIARKKKLKPDSKILQFPMEDYTKGGIYYDRWKWSVINRGGQFAMRLRDLKHPDLQNFKELPYFEYDSSYAVEAFFQPKFNKTMSIPNVLGQIIEWRVLGILKFQLEGKEFELTALDESGKFFLIFSDLTNELETYPIGRYLYVDYPNEKGFTILDFNFSYNPPCAFTPFATCPIPPRVNRLNLAIRAGEKLPLGK